MAEGGDQGDPEYWEHVLSHLKVYKARAKLRALQHTLMEKHMVKLAEIVKGQQEHASEADKEVLVCAIHCCLYFVLLSVMLERWMVVNSVESIW